jgi:diguanylate cyclase (GGDEF)-like protein
MSLCVVCFNGVFLLRRRVLKKRKFLKSATSHFPKPKRRDTVVSLKDDINKKINSIAKLRRLIEVNSIISSSLNKTKVLKNILDQTKLLIGCKKSSILLVDHATNELKFEVFADEEDRVNLADVRLKMGEGIAGFVWQRGKPVVIDDVKKDVRFSNKADEKTAQTTTSLIAVPLIVNAKVIGVMEAINKEENTYFDEFDLELMNHLAVQAAIAIENANLYQLATTDGLTRLFIHRFFQQRLEEEFNRALRYDNQLSIIMFDIDHFKKFNDVYGHQTGDEVLIATAAIIKRNCRLSDVPCRYGGEEISVILPQTNHEGAMLLAERIRVSVENFSLAHDGSMVQLTISGGVASLKAHNPANKDALIKMADQALYAAKKNGRNQVASYMPVETH